MQKKRECVAFGNTVRRFREAARVSQEALADLAGIHRTYIGGIERGERNPTLLMIHRLAKALGINPARLF
jgi:transcriptional regulator with XRE-family HTH domain